MYYIAYGSNLNFKKMKQRCPNAIPVFDLNGRRVNKLQNWKLVFNKYANIIPCKRSFVPIGLWKISKKCEKNLDQYEDYPNLYLKKYIKLFSIKAMVYIMTDRKSKQPSSTYLKGIEKGYLDFDLDLNFLFKSIKSK